MQIREYNCSDCPHLAELFYETVHSVNARDYSLEQLDAWADGKPDLAEWDRQFKSHYTIVACDKSKIIGFGDIDKTGYLDRLYVHKDYQGKGIAKCICRALEKKLSVPFFTTHASITAKPFFEKMGYRTVKEQQVIRRGVPLTNFIMKKANTDFEIKAMLHSR